MMPLEGIPSEHILQIVELATREFGTVFVDLPTNWTNWSLSLVARSDLVLLVTELTVAGLNRARRQLDLLEFAGSRQPRRAGRSSTASTRAMAKTIRPADVREALGRDVAYTIANDFPLMRVGHRPRRSDRRDQAQVARCRQGPRYRSTPALRPPSDWSVKSCGKFVSRSRAKPRSRKPTRSALEEHRLVTVGDAGAFAKRDKHTELKVELHQRLLDLINLQALDQMSREQIEDEVGDIVAEELAKQNHALNHAERKQLVGDVLDELLGLGPLEPLLKDPTITDILVNGHASVFVERYGVLEPSPVRFKDERHLLRIIQKIVSAVGRRIDESSPMVDARLADGSRVNAVVPPLALDGVAAVDPQIRARCRSAWIGWSRSAAFPCRSPRCSRRSSASRRNVLISGGTGSGKTTLLNAMSAYHRRARAHRHDRGFGRAAAAAGACRPARDPAAEHRGQGRSHRSATWSRTRCACGPTGSSSARFAPAKRSTCFRR